MPISEYRTLREYYPHLPQNNNYWDRLPPELQDYIMRLVRNQILLERRRNKKLQRLLKEIVEYGKLKEHWGIGHIKIVNCRCNSPCCIKKERIDRFPHMRIYGCYIDIDDKPQKTYLAPTIKEARKRASIEKTFIYPVAYRSTKYAQNRWLRKRSRSLTEPLGQATNRDTVPHTLPSNLATHIRPQDQ